MPRSGQEVTIGNAVLLMLNCSTIQSLPMHKTPHLLTETDNCHSLLNIGSMVGVEAKRLLNVAVNAILG